MILGRNALVGVWLGSFVANTISFFDGTVSSVHAVLPDLLVASFIGIGTMSGAGAGAFLVRRFCKDEYPLYSGWNVLMLVTVGAFGCCTISPTFGVVSLSLGGYIPWERFGFSWITWWMGDATGAIVAAPLILAWHHAHPFRKNPWRTLEAAVLGGVTLLLCSCAFFRNVPLAYGLMPLLLWAAFRFGMRGASTTAAAIAILATIGTSHGGSPFLRDTVDESLLFLHSFLDVTIICALFLAGVLAERKRAEEALRQSEATLQSVFQSTPVGICIMKNRVFQSANDSWCKSFGYSEKSLLGQNTRMLYESDKEYDRVGRELYTHLQEGNLVTTETRLRRSDGTFRDVVLTAVLLRTQDPTAGTVVSIHDVTERKRAEEELRRVNRALRTVSECNQALVRAPDEATLLTDICHRLVEHGGYRMAWVGLAEQDEAKSVRPVAQAGFEAGYLDTVNITWADTERGRGPTGTAIRTKQPAIARNILTDPAFEPWRQAASQRGYVNSAALPLICDGCVLGALTVYAADLDTFNAGEMELLAELAGDVGYGITSLRARAERKRAEAALQESETRYRFLFEHNPMPMLIYERGTLQMLAVNEAFIRHYGYSPEEALALHLTDLYPEEEKAKIAELIPHLHGHANVGEWHHRKRDGSYITIVVSSHDLEYQGRNARVAVMTDISERKRAEEELRATQASLEERVLLRTTELAEARDHAEAADRTKSAFLATMSHELRTPLNSIIGFTGLMLQGLAGPLNAEQTKQLRMVKDSGQHLLALINDVLDISKIEAGQIEIRSAPFDLPESIQKVLQTVTPLADKKHLPVVLRLAPEVGQITSDRRRVEQILLNLLSNAIKFTEKGGITLTAEIVPDTIRNPILRPKATEGRPPSAIRISVADTGIGIKPEDFDKIFQPFRQLDTGLTRQYEGTGLGLAICQRLAERLGGTISVESRLGKGSTFTFTLPRELVTAGILPPGPKPKARL
jgi:PAS domain S-box-containing protein